MLFGLECYSFVSITTPWTFVISFANIQEKSSLIGYYKYKIICEKDLA